MPAETTSSGFITLSDGGKVFYEQAGTNSGRTLLCLPGGMCSGRGCFSHMLENWSGEFNVVTYDPRGYGKSQETKREFSPTVLHQDATDVAEVMTDLGHDKFSVVGWSDGATIGLILAAKHPLRVEKLIAVAANAFVCKEDMELDAAIKSNAAVSEKMMAYMTPFFEMYGEEGFMELSEEYGKNMQATYERPAGDICRSEVKAIKCPTLVVQGERDEIVARCHADFLHEHIPNSALHIVPNEGHFWPDTCSEDYHRLVRNFLDGNVILSKGK